MLLTPFFCAALLLRQVRWTELIALVAIVFAFAIKDPLVVVARQRMVWKQEHAETRVRNDGPRSNWRSWPCAASCSC